MWCILHIGAAEVDIPMHREGRRVQTTNQLTGTGAGPSQGAMQVTGMHWGAPGGIAG
jgi:hypothetical protein